jgi:early secretory antigenic target protein ESAT-6
MTTAAGIRVNFQTILTAQSDVANAVSTIDQQLNDLRQFLAPMIGEWDGQASGDYQVLQKRWDTAAADLNVVLGETRTLLDQIHQRYVMTERSNANAWA